jgi:hypothetical protein
MSKFLFSLAILCLFIAFPLSSSLVANRKIDRALSWKFIDRFGFQLTSDSVHSDLVAQNAANTTNGIPSDLEYGTLSWEVEYAPGTSFASPLLLVYTDYDDWITAYDADYSLTCIERIALAKFVVPLNKNLEPQQNAPFDNNKEYDELFRGLVAGGRMYFPYELFPGESVIWAFVALANCAESCEDNFRCQGPIVTERAQLRFTNPRPFKHPSDVDTTLNNEAEQFSQDEYGFLNCSLAFLVLGSAVLIFAFKVKMSLESISKFHVTIRLVVISVVIELFAQIFYYAYWANYIEDGVRQEDLLIVGNFLSSISHFFLVLHVILIGKGWTIVRKHLSTGGKMKLIAFGSFYFICIMFIEAFKMTVMDRGYKTYFFRTTPGTVTLLFNLYSVFWFFMAVQTTFKQFPSKHGFYKKFTLISAFWLLFRVWYAIIGYFLSFEKQALFIYIMETLSIMVFQIVILLLYWPTLALKSFPFHSETGPAASGLGEESADERHADEVDDHTLPLVNVGRGMTVHDTEGLLKEIRLNFAMVAKKALNVTPFAEKMMEVLKDWEYDEDDYEEHES